MIATISWNSFVRLGTVHRLHFTFHPVSEQRCSGERVAAHLNSWLHPPQPTVMGEPLLDVSEWSLAFR
jgi:hypothetical protein